MTGLDPADARKLAGSLARLGSPHGGEVIAAAAAVGRILAKAGLGFADLTPAESCDLPPSAEQVRYRVECLLHVSGLDWSDYEYKFLTDLYDFPFHLLASLSAKQIQLLVKLESKANRWNAGGQP